MKKVLDKLHQVCYISVIEFDSISQAYHYYLRHFSTFGDWFYYLKTAHTLLSKVTDERVMLAIFRNVFDERQILVAFKKNS